MSNYPGIVILIPFYGKWPPWIPFFLETCRMNSSIDWIIISDEKYHSPVPDNVKIHRLELAELSSMISSTLKMKVSIIHPYKLTDYKPAYGHIFSALIQSYDFWGYGDMDLVYGQILQQFDPAVFNNFDIISPSEDFFPGHFLILRNTEEIKLLYQKSKDHINIFSSERCYSFDEKFITGGVLADYSLIGERIIKNAKKHLRYYRMVRNPLKVLPGKLKSVRLKMKPYMRRDLNDFNSIINYSVKHEGLKVFQQQLFCDDIILVRDKLNDRPIIWNKGNLSIGTRRIMYYHFQISKYHNLKIQWLNESGFTVVPDISSLESYTVVP